MVSTRLFDVIADGGLLKPDFGCNILQLQLRKIAARKDQVRPGALAHACTQCERLSDIAGTSFGKTVACFKSYCVTGLQDSDIVLVGALHNVFCGTACALVGLVRVAASVLVVDLP